MRPPCLPDSPTAAAAGNRNCKRRRRSQTEIEDRTQGPRKAPSLESFEKSHSSISPMKARRRSPLKTIGWERAPCLRHGPGSEIATGRWKKLPDPQTHIPQNSQPLHPLNHVATITAGAANGRRRSRRQQTPVQKDLGLGTSAEAPDPRSPTLTDPLPATERTPTRQGRGRRDLFHCDDAAAASPSPPGDSNLDNLGPKLPSQTENDGLPPSPDAKTAVISEKDRFLRRHRLLDPKSPPFRLSTVAEGEVSRTEGSFYV